MQPPLSPQRRERQALDYLGFEAARQPAARRPRALKADLNPVNL
jgi:hypothetical protein